jgi:selenide,water dikinase
VVLFDTQTSGGLLISVPGEKADALVEKLAEKNVETRAVIGEVTDLADKPLYVVP